MKRTTEKPAKTKRVFLYRDNFPGLNEWTRLLTALGIPEPHNKLGVVEMEVTDTHTWTAEEYFFSKHDMLYTKIAEGETEHDDIVMGQASRKITDLSVEVGKPVGLGITGPGMSRLQAEARVERAKAAVESVVKMHERLK